MPEVSLVESVHSNIQLNRLGDLKGEYHIPKEYELSIPKGLRGNSILEGLYMVIYEDFLKIGLRFPLHPFVMNFLKMYGVTMSELTPNS